MENDAKGLLILILPFALLMTVLMTVVITAWPLFVVAIAAVVAWKLFQEYQWRQLSVAINPEFRRLIETKQGKITVADLALQTGLTGSAARWFLNRKAKEYGAQAIPYQNKGVVYYFLTVGALGSMFDDSDPDFELEEWQEPKQPSSSPNDIAQLLNITEPYSQSLSSISSLVNLSAAADLEPLIQAELAKRLDVHSSTIRKRRREEGFTEWSKTKDPDSIAWIYSPITRQFIPQI